jgi:hypothetical protein
MAFKLNPLVATLATVLALTAASASAVTLRVGNQGDALSMDPHSLNESLQISVVENVYETLVSRDANYKLTPLLATSWKQTSPTVWRFELRKGVKFHDGTPFTADDVIFSYERAKGDGSEIAALEAITNGQLADVVIDATGSNKSMSHALNYCAFGGTLVYVGITQQEISFLQAPALHRRELTIMGSRNAHSRDFARIIALIEDGSIDTGPWITHRANFADMIAEFPGWLKPENGVIKAMVALT